MLLDISHIQKSRYLYQKIKTGLKILIHTASNSVLITDCTAREKKTSFL